MRSEKFTGPTARASPSRKTKKKKKNDKIARIFVFDRIRIRIALVLFFLPCPCRINPSHACLAILVDRPTPPRQPSAANSNPKRRRASLDVADRERRRSLDCVSDYSRLAPAHRHDALPQQNSIKGGDAGRKQSLHWCFFGYS